MASREERPTIATPDEIGALVRRVADTLGTEEIWLFGSRARADNRPDSDWDLLAVLPDDASDELLDPLVTWNIAREHPGPVTLLSTKRGELDSVWGLPNTLGYDLAREGVLLRVR